MNNPGSAPISETTPPAPAVDPKQGRRAGSAAFIGTTIAWFDFYIYGTASALVLGDLFFPDVSPAMGTLAAFATFAVGFIARPLGGIVFGHFGDKFGRKNTVITTLLLMGLATVGVGLLPTYEQIGFMAPVLLVNLRIIQGVAMGGEWGGAVLIATEFAPPGKKILYGAFAQQGSPVGNLLATVAFLCLTYMSAENFGAWGWRIPFLASAILILVGLYIRLKITESPEMIAATQKEPQKRTPIVELLRNHWKVVSLAIGAVVTGVAITYVKTTFALSWATTDLGFGRTEFLQVVTVALVAQVIVQPFG
ncbi:MAG: MFS transporter, partial [Brevibacterium sp.]|nr:MFS transporter [Brevibacterium sp.]